MCNKQFYTLYKCVVSIRKNGGHSITTSFQVVNNIVAYSAKLSNSNGINTIKNTSWILILTHEFTKLLISPIFGIPNFRTRGFRTKRRFCANKANGRTIATTIATDPTKSDETHTELMRMGYGGYADAPLTRHDGRRRSIVR